MKTSTAAYATERVKLQTAPVYFVRAYYRDTYAAGSGFAFSRDFASVPSITGQTKPKLASLLTITGQPSAVIPEHGRAMIGSFSFQFLDTGGRMFPYFCRPALTLAASVTPSVPGAGQTLLLAQSPAGMPSQGTAELSRTLANGTIQRERIRYSAKNDAAKTLTVSARGVDGTTATSWSPGEAVTNAEHIGPGTPLQLFCGYAALAEADFMSWAVMEVVERSAAPDLITFTVACQDIQHTLRRNIFLSATSQFPYTIQDNPFILALKILTSTGVRDANGPYDTLRAEHGVAIPQVLVDVPAFEALAAEFSANVVRFRITSPEDAKAFLEREIFKPWNAYPVVTQTGALSVKRYRPAPAPGTVTETLTETDVIRASWAAGDRMIVNRVHIFYNWDLSVAPGVFATIRQYDMTESIRKYGPRPPLQIATRVRGDGTPVDATLIPVMDARVNDIAQRFAEPPPILICEVFYRRHTWEIGDHLKVTYSKLPNLKTGQRGITNEVFEIIDARPLFGAEGKFVVTLLWTAAIPASPAPTGLTSSMATADAVPPRPGGLELA